MAIVERAKFRVSSKFRARAFVYFARPTIAIAKIKENTRSPRFPEETQRRFPDPMFSVMPSL